MPLHFQIHHRLSFGDTMLVVGSTKSLGAWDPTKAPPCYWTPDDIWAAAIDPFLTSTCAPSRFEFKFCIQAANGQLHWEPGQNHVAHLPLKPQAFHVIHVKWGIPSLVEVPSQKDSDPDQPLPILPTPNPIPPSSNPSAPNSGSTSTSPPPTPANVKTQNSNTPIPLAVAVAKVTANGTSNLTPDQCKNFQPDELIPVVFRIKYRLAQGESLYILGSIPQLGQWNKAHSPPMILSEDGSNLELKCFIPYNEQFEQFEYKYFTRKADLSRRWEDGENRIARPFDLIGINYNLPVLYDDHWEKIRLDFSIYYPVPETQIMHITGDPPEIGGWFRPGPTPLKLGPLQMLETDVEGRKWKLSVWVNPKQKPFSYRYILIDSKSKQELWEREPNRRASFDPEEPVYNSVHVMTDVNFVADLRFDLVPPDIFIGPYPQTIEDVDFMAKEGVTAVFNVQTDEDFKHRAIQWDLLKKQYDQHDIKVVRFPIRDFDRNSLKERLMSATNELEKLFDEGRKVYIHCTAGMGRAPACAVAYLCWVRNMELETAVSFVKKHRTVAVPNIPVLEAALKEPYRTK